MSFDWRLYIQLAGELINHQRIPMLQEAYLRSAMSRSYYGAFCIAGDLLTSRGVAIPRANTHTFVRTEYQNSPNRTDRAIGGHLSRLWRERKDADYNDAAIIDMSRAITAYQLAINILGKIEGI